MQDYNTHADEIANANPCPMVFTAKDALLITPTVA